MDFLHLTVIHLFVFIYTSVDGQDEQSETFVLNINVDAHPQDYLQLPIKHIPTLNDRNVIRACPAEKYQDKKNIIEISRLEMFYETKYCLFRKSFFEGQNINCVEEVRPLLRAEIDNRTRKPRSCGFSSKHKLYSFGFYYCGESGRLVQLRNTQIRQNLLQFELETLFFPIYEMCVDLSTQKAIWTKHSIMTPAMFQDHNRNNLWHEQGDTTISIEPLLFKGKNYKNMENVYKDQTSKKYPMMKHFMVPMEHIALKTWRKTVTHYIIVAPLWNNLDNLMTGVNDTIKKLALILHSKNQLLTIYTKVKDLSTKSFLSKTIKNTWYKLLHEKTHNLAILIVVQNTPGKPPGPQTDLCETRMNCNMSNWYERRNENDDNIFEQHLQYGMCCIPSTEEIQKLFNVYLDIEGSLDIDFHLRTNVIDNDQPSHEPDEIQVYGE